MQWVRDYKPQPARKRLYSQAIAITLAGNILLVGVKATAAFLSGSVAIYADAANSLSDVLYSFLMMLGLRVAQQPPDLSHPQGHSRFEPLIGLVVALAMASAGYEALRASIDRFISGGKALEAGLPILILLGSAVLKSGMYYVINRIAIKVSSPSLRATATDNLVDVSTSVAAILGVLGSHFIHPLFDPLAGLVVAAWILRAAYRAGWENLRYLTGAGAPPELRREIVQIAESVPGVIKVHHLMTDYSGPKFVVDLHINVDGQISVTEAHLISDQVNAALVALPEVDRAYVHVEPEGIT